MSKSLPKRLAEGLSAGFWKMRSSQHARRFWERCPQNQFTRHGYEVIPNFLPPAECQRLVQVADSLMKERSYRIKGDCYTTVRSEIGIGVDTQVSQIMNIELVDEALARMKQERVIQKLFEERVGERVAVKGFSIQIDGVDTKTKRGYHLDGTFPPNFKAFVYLTDVEIMGDGPYTIVPGSHRHIWRKAANEFINSVRGYQHSDMHALYSDRQSKSFLARAGTLILSTQDLAHKGWHDQHHAKRYNMIVFLNLERFFDGKPIQLGVHRLREDKGREAVTARA